MSLAAIFHTGSAPRRSAKRGRPSSKNDPAQRQLHMTAAILRIVEGLTVEEAAERLQVAPSTVKRWTDWALEYGGPAANRLRAIANRPN